MDDNELVFVEYSRRQDCFHIDDVTRSLKTNLTAFLNVYNDTQDVCPDYIPIGIFNSRKEAQDFTAMLRDTIYKSTGDDCIARGRYATE